MKVLVLTCSTGGGHNSCARYIQEEFQENNIVCDVKDYMEIIGPKASRIAEKIYLDSTKNNGLIFKGVYKLGEIYSKTNIPSPVYGLNSLVKEKLYNYIINNNYNLVIGTHLFPCVTLTAIKKEHEIKFINVATDYECIPFWEETNPDLFIIPSDLLKERFSQKGIKAPLLGSGIPISSRFSRNLPMKKEKNILLVSGSMGFGKIKVIVPKLLSEIPEDYTLTVICGNNQNLVTELSKLESSKLIVKGFVHNLNEYIKKSTLVITKPGGLTTTEVAVLQTPLILMMPIPGVENYNANFFKENKMALKADNLDDIIMFVQKLIEDQNLQKEMIKKQKEIINKHSALDLVQYCIKNFNVK